MPSSHQFKLRSIDLAKLQSIRTAKNNKKRTRIFEAMGLSGGDDRSSNSKRIIQLKRTNANSSSFRPSTGMFLTSPTARHMAYAKYEELR